MPGSYHLEFNWFEFMIEYFLLNSHYIVNAFQLVMHLVLLFLLAVFVYFSDVNVSDMLDISKLRMVLVTSRFTDAKFTT